MYNATHSFWQHLINQLLISYDILLDPNWEINLQVFIYLFFHSGIFADEMLGFLISLKPKLEFLNEWVVKIIIFL